MTEQFAQLNVTGSRAHRLVYRAAQSSGIESLNLEPPENNEVIVQTIFSGISRGTERLVYAGLVPESEWESMKCPYQAGNFSYPVSYGYSCVGEVVRTGSEVENTSIGKKVFVLHPHQDMFRVAETDCHGLPDNLPAHRAVLSANMETALNAVWDSEVGADDRCAIVGAGIVGTLVAYLVRKFTGTEPLLIDNSSDTLDMARRLGLETYLLEKDKSHGLKDFDCIFNTSGSGSGLQLAIDIAGFEALLVETSWYGSQEVRLQLGGPFHSKRLRIISSQVGNVARPMRDQYTHSDRMQKAMKLLCDPALDCLVGDRIEFQKLPKLLPAIFDKHGDNRCPLVFYHQDQF